MATFSFLPHVDISQSGLIFHLAQPSDVDEIADFLINNFYKKVPTLSFVELDVEKEVRPWFSNYVLAVVKDGHSIVVRDTSKGNQLAAAGLRCVEEKSKTMPTTRQYANLTEKSILWTSFRFLKLLQGNIDLFEEYRVDRILHLCMASVHDQYTRRGIAEKLIILSIEMAKCEKIQLVAAQSVNHFASKNLVKTGFECINQVLFDDYVDNGTKPFANNGIHQKGQLMVLKLS